MRTRPKYIARRLASNLAPIFAFTLASTAAAAAFGQVTDESTKLPEVVVSAERVEAALRKTPVSVAVVGDDAIERKGIAQLSDLVGVVAGVAVPNGFSNMPQAVGIRGVGVSNPAMSQAVGIYVDDVPLVRGYATALWDLPDIVRIEVLRGPQGTLYGQNTSAGAVKIVSRDPGSDETAWLSVSAGNRGALEARGYGAFQLSPNGTSASLAFSRRTNDGFGRNATLNKNVNELDARQFRAKFKQNLTSSFSAVLAIDGLLDKSDANTTNFPLNHPNSRPRITYTGDDRLGAFERRAGGIQLKLDRRFDGGTTFRSISAFRTFRDDPTRPDWGGLEQMRSSLDQTVEQHTYSQELQLQGTGAVGGSAANWTAGAMLVHDRFDFERFSTAVPLATNTPQYTEAQTRLKTTDLGVYGQGRLSLTSALSATAGLRAYRTRQTGANAFYRTNQARQRSTTVYEADDLRFSKGGVLPRVGLDYQWTDLHLLYASVSEGAKFGGYNRAAESLQSALVATSPEKIRAYELGAKSRVWDGRVTTSLAAFYNDYRDYLAVLNNTTINGVLVVDPVMVNAGKARTYGVDLEVAAKLSSQLEWSGSVEWLRSKFTEFANPTGAAGTDFVGNELPYAPRLSAGTTLSYLTSLRSGAAVRFDASAQYIRKQFADVSNSALLALPSQVYVNLGASYVSPNGQWTFSMRVKNLQDKTYVLLRTRIPPLGVDSAYYNAPRTLLFTGKYEF